MSNPYAPPAPGKRPEPDEPAEHGRGSGSGDQPPSGDDARRPQQGRSPQQGRWPQQGSGPGGGATPPHSPSPNSPPDPEAVQAANRQVLTFSLLMLATVLTYALPLPWSVAALAFSLAAVVVGGRATWALWRAKVGGAMVTMVSLFVLLAGIVTLTLATMLALYPLQAERQACLGDALTISARQQCEAEFMDAVEERLSPSPAPG